jgi:hypothetical protein
MSETDPVQDWSGNPIGRACGHIAVGQLWMDNDKRCKTPRTLRVDAILPGFGSKAESFAKCTVLETGKQVRVLLRRLHLTSNGYRLVEDVLHASGWGRYHREEKLK